MQIPIDGKEAELVRGVVLPGRRTVELRQVADPKPGNGQVVVRVRASGLCGSDLRVIYRRSPGDDTPYQDGRIAGHEPCGDVVEIGPWVRSVGVGDRVAVYHIAGCGHCRQCRVGWQVACESELRQAYGYHRDGGHAPYLLAEERSLIRLPDELTFADGALASCGLGTAYQAILRAELSARDTVLITGLGPLGLGMAMLAEAFGADVVAVEPNPVRRSLASRIMAGPVLDVADNGDDELIDRTGGWGFSVVIDCSGAQQGRMLGLRTARRKARVVFLGEGGEVSFEPSPLLIHKEISLLGSWVCNIATVSELFEFLARKELHVDSVITHRFGLTEAETAYRLFDKGETGKVIIE